MIMTVLKIKRKTSIFTRIFPKFVENVSFQAAENSLQLTELRMRAVNSQMEKMNDTSKQLTEENERLKKKIQVGKQTTLCNLNFFLFFKIYERI